MQLIKENMDTDGRSPLLENISPITNALEHDNLNNEPIFIEIGERLLAICQQAQFLESQAEAAVGLISGRTSNGVLVNINELTTGCVCELRDWQSRISACLVGAGDITARLALLAPNSTELKKIAKRLGTLNVYFSVESSRYPESSNAFVAYTSELSKLVKHIFEVTADIERDSSDAQKKQIKACESISKGASELNELAFISEMGMQEASNEVDEIARFATSAMERIKALSNDISVQIGKVVLALQFHDITRQQIEHVVDALRDAEKLLPTLETCTLGPSDTAANLGRAYSILSVQSAQMSQVIETLRNAHSTIQRCFSSIGDKSTCLISEVAVADTDNQQSSKLNVALTRLAEALGVMRQLLTSAKELGEATVDTAQMASEATQLLSRRAERVEDINMDINIQALNAVITSIRLREKGSTLAILAQEVTSLSERCDVFVVGIADILQDINRLAATMIKQEDTADKCEDAGANDTASCMEALINRISETCADYETYSLAMIKDAKSVQEMVAQTSDMLGIIPELADRMQDRVNEIDELASKLKGILPADFCKDLIALEEHTHRYTMQSERNIHQRALGSDEISERRGEDEMTMLTGAGLVDDDDLGDNIELF